jgi:hypothetical protein
MEKNVYGEKLRDFRTFVKPSAMPSARMAWEKEPFRLHPETAGVC